MEQLILMTIDHVRNVSKRKVSLDSILQRINKTSATNLDNETLKLELDQMIIKGLIDQNYKILDRDRLHLDKVLSPDKVNFTVPNENGDNIEINLQEDLQFINTQKTPLTKSQVSLNNPKSETPLILNIQKELDNMRAKMLALKSFFMNEIYDLKQGISSVRSQLEQERLHHSRNNDCVEKEESINQKLKDTLHSCQIENQLLREEIKNKQKTIETILYQNNELLKFNHYFDQNKMGKKIDGYKTTEHKEKGNDSKTDDNQQVTSTNKIPRKNNNLATENNISQLPAIKKKKIFIVGDSLIKNITGTGISRDHTVKIRPHPGATNIDMCDYIKPELRHQPDVIILHCGTNDIPNEIHRLQKLKKLLNEIEGYDTHKKPQVVISGLIKRYDQDFNEDIKSMNEKIQRLCISKGLSFIVNSNIDKSCLNRSKLHLNRRGSSFLANNFKKFVNSL